MKELVYREHAELLSSVIETPYPNLAQCGKLRVGDQVLMFINLLFFESGCPLETNPGYCGKVRVCSGDVMGR